MLRDEDTAGQQRAKFVLAPLAAAVLTLTAASLAALAFGSSKGGAAGGGRVSLPGSPPPDAGRRGEDDGGDRLGLSTLRRLDLPRDPRTIVARGPAAPPPDPAPAPEPAAWDAWYLPHVEDHARTWPSRAGDRAWCKTTKPSHGLFYVKTPKTGSSSAAAVTKQAARNVAARRDDPTIQECRHWNMHNTKRDPARSVMWTTVRDPARQAMSYYFFGPVSRRGEEPWTGDWKAELNRLKNFQTNYVGQLHPGGIGSKRRKTLHPLSSARPDEVREVVRDVMDHYDFVAITERMDESLVVFKLLLGLADEDIVNLGQNKHAGGFDDGRTGHGCVRIAKSYASPEAAAYLGGDFRVGNHDFFLYDVAVRSLDRTIDALGRDLVADEVAKLKAMQELVRGECLATTVFPCTKEGPPNPAAKEHCYSGDMGCGHACVQRTLARYREGTLGLSPASF